MNWSGRNRMFLVVLVVGFLGLSQVSAAAPGGTASAGKKGKAPPQEFVEEVLIDIPDPSHAGPGPHPTSESDSFKLMQGGIRWLGGVTVEYEIIGLEPVAGANAAANDAIEAVDTFVTTRDFAQNNASTQINPCTGQRNRMQWSAIDGAGGVLATAASCRNVATKEIVGFRVTFDAAESWGTTGLPDKFDVMNTGVHEFLHVAGLDHVNAPRDGCLSIYRFAAPGETQKRTLGLGDKLGMDALYDTGDTTPGPGCGS